jgi:hypothetical protein
LGRNIGATIPWGKRFSRRFGPAQLDPEAAPFARFRFDTDFAAHPLDSFFDNGQPDASALEFSARMRPFEKPEDPAI